MRIIGGDDAGPEPFVCQLVDGGDAAAPAGIKRRRVIVGFDGMRSGLGKGARLLSGYRIPFGVRNALTKAPAATARLTSSGTVLVVLAMGKSTGSPLARMCQSPAWS
jgi:hypothetical protein